LISAEKVKDHNDYLTREPAFFTMSAYLVNMFGAKDSSKLLESINLSHVKIFPSILTGTKNCLFILDHLTARNITLCLKDSDTVKQVKELYQQFMICRAGRNFNDKEPFDIQELLKASCSGAGNQTSLKYDLNRVKTVFAEELRKNGVSLII
jgi:hypothetical protein